MNASGAYSNPAVQISNVTKRFGRHTAVNDLSLTVPEGCIYGFIGPNGSGKTTTMRMILRIFDPDAGSIRVLGKTGLRAANDEIGYLPEERGLYRKMSVRRVLAYFGGLKGMDGRSIRAARDYWLERMELQAWGRHKTEALSKGMAQKIQFIAAVIASPKLLILDEPFSGLDPVNLDLLQRIIVELRNQGTTIIFSTHDMSTAEKMCDFIFMILRGRKVLDGKLSEIQAQYGADTIRVRVEGGTASLNSIPGVIAIRDLGQYQEVRYEGDSQIFLQLLAERHQVHLFEVTRPSLHDIFVRIAGTDALEDAQ